MRGTLWIYIAGLSATIFATAAIGFRLGTKPGGRQMSFGALGGLIFGVVFAAFISVLHPEGLGSRILLLLTVECAAILIFVRRASLSIPLCTGIWFFSAFLYSLHFRLATSGSYTDNPRYRRIMVTRLNSKSQSSRPPRTFEIEPEVHTWLTGIYRVTPPFRYSETR